MKNKKVLIVVSNYNKFIGNRLQKNAVNYIKNYKWIQQFIIEAPGAFEIPLIIEKNIRKFDGVVALGCIIKGETKNFDLICSSVTDALMQLSIKHKKPVGNGIITCFNKKQAIERINKAKEAAEAVQKIINIKKI